jgi:putative AdoMet-dependent methyltransferase
VRSAQTIHRHKDAPADAMISVAALHHLPDFWKQIGLKRAVAMLKPGGRLHLFDVVFPSDLDNYAAHFDEWIGFMAQKVGAEFAAEAETHIREEYSTIDWIMEGLLDRAGFRIDKAEYESGFGASYLCTRR